MAGYNPDEPRNAEGEWTDGGNAIRKAASDKKPIEIIKTEKGNILERDVKSEKIRNDEGHRLYQIKSGSGERLGSISLIEEKDGYHVEVSTIFERKKGTGKDAYKALINSLDKPLISDISLTPDSKGLWQSLERDGYAEFNKKEGKYFGHKKGG